MPNLLLIQKESYRRFLQEDVRPSERTSEGLQGVFQEIFPIEDVHGRYSLEFVSYRVGAPKQTPEEAKNKKLTYAVPIWATLRLVRRDPETGQLKDLVTQDVYLCDLPYMTDRGTFVINGIERVVVNQLHRSPGVYYDIETRETTLYKALLVPYRGPWIELVIDGHKTLSLSISKRRKIPFTRLLRALGFETTTQILEALLADLPEPEGGSIEGNGKKEKRRLKVLFEAKVSQIRPEDGYVLAQDIPHPQTGELMLEVLTPLDGETLEMLKQAGIEKVRVVDSKQPVAEVVLTTLKGDRIKDRSGALGNIYRTLRYTPPRDDQEAQEYIESYFFSKERLYLSKVGRYKLNLRLRQKTPEDQYELTKEDLLNIVKRLLLLYAGEENVDDVDDLSNRRVRRVGELLYEQFRIALLRLARVIRERMLLEKEENISPKRLVNPRLVTASILAFFTGDRLSQFLDQTNPLSELTHKRRLSALGKGGLTRETAGFEVRDVHPSHYGRLCPIETPEGQNIGLIVSLTNYARIDEFGFITTPLMRVKNGVVTGEVVELAPHEESRYKIAPADTPVDPKTGKILADQVWVRYRGGYPMVKPEEVDFIDVSPRQLVSPSASLIPFLEHDDANRALMGSNMQRQAVPLIVAEPPIVGTGMERKIAMESGAVVLAERDGIVESVDASRIVVRPISRGKKRGGLLEDEVDVYDLVKFQRSNQNTAINQRPRVKVGQRVKKGDLLADGTSTYMGELALGKNLLVAFIPWYGYNFEDAIVISERVVRDDVLTSIHILEFEVEVRETKLGPEEVTRDLPSVSQEALKNLDENGIVRIGAEVKPDDILVGKVSPKGERELTPEERLIYAIFAEKAKDVRDTSKRVPPGVSGVVVDVVVLSRRKDDPLSKRVRRERERRIKMEAAEAENRVVHRLQEALAELLEGKRLKKSLRTRSGELVLRSGEVLTREFLRSVNPLELVIPEAFIEDEEVEDRVRELLHEGDTLVKKLRDKVQSELQQLDRGDELPPGVLQLIKVYIAQKRKLQVGDKLAGRHGNKGVVAKIAPIEDMPFLDDGTPVDIVLNPLGVPSRMNVGQVLETILGWAGAKKGVKYACPVFQGFTIEQIAKELREAGLPENGKTRVRDGRSGEYLDFDVTVGYIYMMKLIHMVEDKVHARAIGPYSLITQQPVGGKSHFGGQRFGEMEVWALEAHGAAYTLQEMLTVKSDDIKGRNALYQAIIRGEETPEPGLPASFDVLLKELRGLGLDIEIETE